MIRLSDTPVLETDRLILRAPEAGDWPVCSAFLASDRSRFIRSGEIDLGRAWRAFGHVVGHWVLRGWGQFVMVDRTSGAVLGSCGPWFPADWPERELGWSLWAPEAEGKGFAHEAVLAVRRHAFGVLGWDTAVSYIDPANARSRVLAQRLGCWLDTGAAQPGEAPVQVWRHTAGGMA